MSTARNAGRKGGFFRRIFGGGVPMPPDVAAPPQADVMPTPQATPTAAPVPQPEPVVEAAPPHAIFISYARTDGNMADRIYDSLIQARFSVWLDRSVLEGGQVWKAMILQAIDQCRWMVVILSPDALESPYVRMEYERALQQGKTVIPLRHRDGGTTPKALSALHEIDFRENRKYHQGMDELLHALRGEPSPGPVTRPRATPERAIPLDMPRVAHLVGRDAELTAILAALRAGQSAGVYALEGMGGIGKSALAATAVTELARDRQAFPGGAAWIPCENLTGDAGLNEAWSRVARYLGLDAVAQEPEPEQRRLVLARSLAQRSRTLLALDNIEPGLDARALVTTLAIDGHTALLLTARQQLDADVDQQVILPPLPEPDGATMFAERLRHADATRPSDAERALLPTLAQALAGLPLAVELTAAYAGNQHLSLERVLSEVRADGLTLAPLQRLRTRFDRSWQILPATQQRLFAGLALLAGASFPRAAAEALAGEAKVDVADLVTLALVEPVANERLRLHPFLRVYAEDHLRALPQSEQDALGDAMLAYWLAFARAHPSYEGVFILEAEAEGLMGALQWAHERERHRELLTLVKNPANAWYTRGRRDEQRQMYTWAVEAADAVNDPYEQNWMYHSLALLNSRQGRILEAKDGYEKALAFAKEQNDLSAERAEVHGLAVLARQQGQVEEARQGFERALALAQQLGDLSAERDEVHSLAVLAANQGQIEEARQGFERALALAQQLGDRDSEGIELQSLGILFGYNSERERGRELLQQSLEIFAQTSNVLHAAESYQRLGWLERDNGNRDAAVTCFREALWRFVQIGSPEAEEVRRDLVALEVDEGEE